MITAQDIKKLRDFTGARMMECKKALEESEGDFKKAEQILRKQGIKIADKKLGRSTSEGFIGSYIHGNGKVGVLVEINCETDFVARNKEFREFAHDLAMHIAALQPKYLDLGDIEPEITKQKREEFREETKGKPREIAEKIVEGKTNKYFEELCLMTQPFVKDPDKIVKELVTETIAKLGENIIIKKFVRFEI